MRLLSILAVLFVVQVLIAGEISVTIKGMDDGVKTNKQQDHAEAVMNAKMQAIEQAGAEITSITKIQNFKMKYDAVESKSEGILLPGFQIMDIGYQTDGTYLVILTGKIKTEGNGDKVEEIYNKAVLLIKREDYKGAKELLEYILNKYDGTEFAVKAYDEKVNVEEKLKKIKEDEERKLWANNKVSYSLGNIKHGEDSGLKDFYLVGKDRQSHHVRISYSAKHKKGFLQPKGEIKITIHIDGRYVDSKSMKYGLHDVPGNNISTGVIDKVTGIVAGITLYDEGDLEIHGYVKRY